MHFWLSICRCFFVVHLTLWILVVDFIFDLQSSTFDLGPSVRCSWRRRSRSNFLRPSILGGRFFDIALIWDFGHYRCPVTPNESPKVEVCRFSLFGQRRLKHFGFSILERLRVAIRTKKTLSVFFLFRHFSFAPDF